jgi:predicted enzyme related to lactoylglutathione lyase
MEILKNAEMICFAATKNSEAAKKFYEGTLELTLIEDSPFALVFDVNGVMLRVQKVQEFTAAKHTTLGWKVTDIRSTIKNLATKGVQCQRYEGMSQDELGIWQSPSGALVAWFLDPDGNGLSLTEFSVQK